MSAQFFDTNSYFIDEKVNFLKFNNHYKIFNDKGENIGSIKQKISAGHKVLKLLINNNVLPFHLEIQDSNDVKVASVSRGWTLFMSKISIKDANDIQIGSIQQKFKLFKPTFKIFNNSDTLIAEIVGDWKAWNFKINDASQNEIGSISKKWAGAMKEIFTTADKYNVTIDPAYSNTENKIAILAGAITIDMVLKENK